VLSTSKLAVANANANAKARPDRFTGRHLLFPTSMARHLSRVMIHHHLEIL
jgi:hypothetical protein